MTPKEAIEQLHDDHQISYTFIAQLVSGKMNQEVSKQQIQRIVHYGQEPGWTLGQAIIAVRSFTDSQKYAYQEGYEAWYNGDICHRQFSDTIQAWKDGLDAAISDDPQRTARE